MESQALYIPKKKMKVKKNNPKWFNNDIKKAILARNKAYTVSKINLLKKIIQITFT